jgi:hypothetical protein
MIDGDESAGSRDERDALHQALASNAEWWIRGMALKRLAKLEGPAGIARLIDALSGSDLRKDALEGLASLAAGSNDPVVLEALDNEIRRGDSTHISAAVSAFLAVGGNVRSLAQDTVDRLEPEMAMTVRWLLSDIGPREVAAKLQFACGDVPVSGEMLQGLDAKWRTEPNARDVIWSLLGGWNRLACIFYKTVGSPVDHDETVYQMTTISGEHFALDEVIQTTESGGDFRVLLVHQGIGYSFPVENQGRWCNIRAVIDGLNGILDSLGLAERFIELNSGTGDVALVTFARADLFLPLARELDIPLGRSDQS